MTLPFKPALLVLLCSAGLFAASGVLYVKSRTPQTPVAVEPAAQTPPPAPVTPEVKPAFSAAQIDQWVAPIALYPDALLSQVLMASTYPANVVQAVQWSRDNPTLQGDAAIQAVTSQPWDASVKSLVAFPQLLALMGENPPWVQNLGDAFLAQPQDVMDAVQRLRTLAEQTGALKSTPQQKVTSVPKKANASSTTTVVQSSGAPAPSSTVIKIEPADPQVVYVPSYNPATVYGTWPNTAYPPVYLPPPPGQQFTSSFVKGFGYSLGVATTYALFSHIDWDDDDYHHHDDDWNRGGYSHNGDNINIDVNNFNRISGQHLREKNITWRHDPTYRNGLPYRGNAVAPRLHPTDVPGGLSATVNRDSQRQAALARLQEHGATASRDAQRTAASQQLNRIAQRNNYRGYDDTRSTERRTAAREAIQQRRADVTPEKHQQRREAIQQRRANVTPEKQQQRREAIQQRRESGISSRRGNVLSGNDSRSPSWQAQQQRGQQSRHSASQIRERHAERHSRAEGRELRRH